MKKKQSKSAAIRKAFETTESPKKVAEILKKRGIEVTAAYASVVKASDKKRAADTGSKREPVRTKRNGTNVHSPPENLLATGELLMQAMDLVVKAGGEKQALEMVRVSASMLKKLPHKA